MKKSYFLLFLITSFSFAQAPTTATPAEKAQQALKQREAMVNKSLVKNIPLENIGPSIMSGRVTDVDVNPNRPTEFYVSYASGGLWYTDNNGISFESVMDNAPTQNIGDIAVDWKNDILWVGTGENNSSRSSYAGIGILKSSDKGKTWQHMGLSDSHHIGRILINPTNPNEVVVGVLGHLYSPNAERGIYKTTDGGNTWKQTLFVSDVAGIIDMAHVPNNFAIMYASAWEKDRKAWHFEGSGNGSGIYKSTDGGSSWTKVSTSESGFPSGSGVGRIGLAVYDENTLYAVHDNQFRRKEGPDKDNTSDVLDKNDFKTMGVQEFLALDNKKLNEFLKTNGFQEKYRAENVKQLVQHGSVRPIDLAKYLENANSLLFDTPVIGAEVYRSDDGGKTWQKRNKDYIDGLYYSYGYYFGEIRVSPQNHNKIYLGGVPLIASKDGGETYHAIHGDNVHSDHQALWVNPARPGHLLNGNDGGLNMTYDDGEHWNKLNSPTVGQFYAIQVDNQEPYHVYGGLQDNGVWGGPHNAKENSRWHGEGQYPWKRLLGGDGMQVEVDNRNHHIVYTGFQFGNYFRLNKASKKHTYIQPKHELGEEPYRFNWQTPILLSPHNQDILYLGSNRLHRSLNQGNDWEAISPDLTQGGRKGNVAYGTLTCISESPFQFGLMYVGSDDGLVQMTQNAGGSWQTISTTFPKDLWVSRVVASAHKKERVYVALNGYRWDNFTPYIYVSEDHGQNWKSIAGSLPTSPVNAIVEDPVNENLLYIGTDNGVYASFDQGATWHPFQNGIPPVAVHDLKIQQEANHLLVGTHGRSIYKADIAPLQKLTPEILGKDLYVYQPRNLNHSTRWGNAFSNWSKPQTPGLDIVFHSKAPGKVSATILTANDIEVSSAEMQADKGLNILSYDVAFSKKGKSNYLKKNKTELKMAKNGKTYLPKGKYTILLKCNGPEVRTSFEIE
ncbi:MAG: glycosyl hydrolase [Flavobacteriaceae bacterium]